MNYTFITKSQEQISDLISHLAHEINKEANPTLSEASDLLQQVVEKFKSLRQESKLNIDLMKKMVAENQEELNKMFPYSNSRFTCYETKFSVTIAFNTREIRNKFQNTRDYDEAIAFLEKEFKNANIDCRTFKIQRIYSDHYMTLEFSLPKEVDTAIFMNQLRNLCLYFSDIMTESINQLDSFLKFKEAVKVCVNSIRVNQERYSSKAIANQTISSIKKGDKGKAIYTAQSGLSIDFAIKDNELVFTMPNKKHISLSRKITNVKEALIQYV